MVSNTTVLFVSWSSSQLQRELIHCFSNVFQMHLINIRSNWILVDTASLLFTAILGWSARFENDADQVTKLRPDDSTKNTQQAFSERRVSEVSILQY